jgi:hypothetical protein
MVLPTYFSDFLQEIRPTKNQNSDAKTGHRTLRTRLLEDEDLALIIVTTFLQGSYRRATAIRPNGECRSDVDVIVVTNLSEEKYSPQAAMDLFVPFLDKHYKGKWEFRGRSIRISLSYVDLDLVITSAPSLVDVRILKSFSVITDDTLEELDDWRLVPSWVDPEHRNLPGMKAVMKAAETEREEDWRLSPLRIPDRDTQKWEDTHPLEQIRWTWRKNKDCSRHYVNVVKAMKWERKENHATPKYPKGYPLEHIIGQCCPNGIASIAEGVTLALEEIVARFAEDVRNQQVPFLPDHGVPSHNVLHRITPEDFAEFYAQIRNAAVIARRALDADTVRESAEEWRRLFGSKFPAPPEVEKKDSGGDTSNRGGYSPRAAITGIAPGRYAAGRYA